MAKKAASASPSKSKSRHFELIKGDSAKFWEIEPTADGFQTHYGRIGAKGQTTVKEFPDFQAAHEAMEKIIAEKIDEGYVEIKAH